MRALFVQPATEGATLDAPGQAFSAALEHNGGPVVAFVTAVVALGVLVGLVGWALREPPPSWRAEGTRGATSGG